jgi:hypothetical protein
MNARVTGGFAVGILAGANDGEITGCFSTGTVRALRRPESNTGGLVGVNGGRVERSYSSANVSANGNNAGGLIGLLTTIGSGWVNKSQAFGTVSAPNATGGLIGYIFGGSVTECLSTTRVDAAGTRGGLIGTEFESVNPQYNTLGRHGHDGAFVDAAKIANSFWDINQSGVNTSSGQTGRGAQEGKTTEELTQRRTYEDAGWNFDDGTWFIPDDGSGVPQIIIEGNPSYTITYQVENGIGGHLSIHGARTDEDVVAMTLMRGMRGIEVTAVADVGYRFVRWDIDNDTSTVRSDIADDGDLTITAIFELPEPPGPGVPARVAFISPMPLSQIIDLAPQVISPALGYSVMVEVQDIFGDPVGAGINVSITSSDPDIGTVTPAIAATNIAGIASFIAQATNDATENETFDLIASIAVGGVAVSDVARLRVGRRLDDPLITGDITVSQNPDDEAMFSSIQAAVNRAAPGAIITILDAAVYEEQVTIDSTKNNITIRSSNPLSQMKPVIMYRDTTNRSPRNYAESQIFGFDVGMVANYETCGALRILRAHRITIDGIIVDGGGPAPFGAANVWDGMYAMFHGNAAITLSVAGSVVIRNCELRNAYFGINVKDRNTGGVFANPNPNDLDPVIPLSGFGMTGNHLFEYNRIHDNSVGIFFESAWDMGSTVRYNMMFNNFHTAATQAAINLLPDAGNQVSGAFLFKDMMYSPLAIYNNTYHNNTGVYFANWQVGAQHLIFNNIHGSLYTYPTSPGYLTMGIDGNFANRMHNSVYPVMPPVPPGGTPFPAASNVRQFDMSALFMSTTPSSPDFLRPDWDNPQVVANIMNGGWEAAGIRNSNGQIADLGAVSSAGRSSVTARIMPVDVVSVSGTTANSTFLLNVENGVLNNPQIRLVRWISPIPANADSWGNNVAPVPATSVTTITPPASALNVGINMLSFTLLAPPAITNEYGFFEIVVQGTDAAGNMVTSDVGFLPWRRISLPFPIATDEEDEEPSYLPSPPSNFTVGPNPIGQDGAVNFFWDGGDIVSGTLFVYSSSGNLVSTIDIRDGNNLNKSRSGSSGDIRRQIGSWNIADRRSRGVPTGSYLIRGVIITEDGKRERVSVVVGVR